MNKRQRKKKSKQIKPISLEDLQKKTPKQLNQYSPERLRKTYQKLRATANKRLERLNKAGFFTENIYKEYEFEFINPARDLTDGEIKEKLLQLRKFLSTEESTVRGQKKREKAEKDFAEQLFKALHEETEQEQEQAQEREQEQVQEEKTRQYRDKKRDNVTGREDFIDISDPDQREIFNEFMATIKYNLSAEIFYDIRELYDLWNLWLDEGKPMGSFSKASRNFRQGLMKFASSQRTSVKNRTRRSNR